MKIPSMNKNIKQGEQASIEQAIKDKQQNNVDIEEVILICAEASLYVLAIVAFMEALDIWVRGGSEKLMMYRTAMIIVHSVFSCGFMLGGLMCAIIRNIKTKQ